MRKLFTLLTLLVVCVTGAWASTEQIKTVSKDGVYNGTCVTLGKDHFAQDHSDADYIKMRTGNYSNTWVITVKDGYKVTGISISGYSNNTGATISMTSLTTDGTEQLDANVVFPVSGTATTSYASINKSNFEVKAGKTIVCSFDNSNIITDKNAEGYSSAKNKQIMAKITLTYEEDADPTAVATPDISFSSNKVSISCSTAGALIYYTTDGSEPTSSATQYSSAVTLPNSCTIRAKAFNTVENEVYSSEEASKDCYVDHSAADGFITILKWNGGALDGENAKIWKSTDGEYVLTNLNNDQTNKWSNLETSQDAFKLSHMDGYTLAVPSDVKITKVAFIGKSLYRNLAGTITINTEGFTPSNASFIQNADEDEFAKYLSAIEFATSSLDYGDAIEFHPGGCESAAYIEVYGVKRSGPAAQKEIKTVTWDFTDLTAQSFTQNSSYSFKANDGTTEMRYSAGSSDAIVAKNGNTNGYLKENGTTSTSNSVVDIDGETVVGKNRLIRLYVSGKGKLTINCGSNVGAYTVKDGSTNGNTLLSAYTANNQSSEITVSNFLWIETTTKGYINSIVWTPSTEGVILTTTNNMAGWRAFYDASTGYTVDNNTKIYIVTAKDETKATLAEVTGRIPAQTPVLLKTSADNRTMTLTKATSGTDIDATENKLTVTDGTAVSNAYRLGYGAEGVGFYPYSATSPASGIVYLSSASQTPAKALTLAFSDDVTGISGVSAKKAVSTGKRYNLSGQLVGEDYKGIVIENGKKYIK